MMGIVMVQGCVKTDNIKQNKVSASMTLPCCPELDVGCKELKHACVSSRLLVRLLVMRHRGIQTKTQGFLLARILRFPYPKQLSC